MSEKFTTSNVNQPEDWSVDHEIDNDETTIRYDELPPVAPEVTDTSVDEIDDDMTIPREQAIAAFAEQARQVAETAPEQADNHQPEKESATAELEQLQQQLREYLGAVDRNARGQLQKLAESSARLDRYSRTIGQGQRSTPEEIGRELASIRQLVEQKRKLHGVRDEQTRSQAGEAINRRRVDHGQLEEPLAKQLDELGDVAAVIKREATEDDGKLLQALDEIPRAGQTDVIVARMRHVVNMLHQQANQFDQSSSARLLRILKRAEREVDTLIQTA